MPSIVDRLLEDIDPSSRTIYNRPLTQEAAFGVALMDEVFESINAARSLQEVI